MRRSSSSTKKVVAKKPAGTGPAKRARHRVELINVTVPDAVALLRTDHKKMRQLLTELKSAEKPASRQRLLAQVTRELEAHTAIEEEIFYPAFLAAAQTKKDQQLFHEATAEHHAAKLMLHEVGSADDATAEFPGRAKVLKELVEHHAGEEETDMFPRARKLIDAAELRSLGRRMAERKRSLLLAAGRGTSTMQKVANFVTSSFSSPAKVRQPDPSTNSHAETNL